MKRNNQSTVTTVTAASLPVLYGSPKGRHDGYGIWFTGTRRGFEPLRVMNRDVVLEMLSKTRPGETPQPLDDNEWNTLQAAYSLKNALENKDDLELERAFRLLNIDYAAPTGGSPDLQDVVALDQLSKILPAVKLVYWFDNREAQERLSPGIYCPDLKTALIVSALFGDSFRICPKCQTVFFSSNTYCTLKCQGAHRVARFRARNKTQKKGGR